MTLLYPHSPQTPDFLEAFRETAEAGIGEALQAQEGPGMLDSLRTEHREDGVYAIATFRLDSHPDVTFVRTRNILPATGTEGDARFASALFTTTLFEKLHTEARHREPTEGEVRY